MPKQVNDDAQAYDKEYDAFLKQLEEFHQQRGTPFKRLPRINGKGIDLYLLYVVVTARGGWQKVNSRNEWDDILEDFRLPASCVNASTALKHIYIRYLDSYERINYLGEDCDERSNDPDEDESRALRQKRSVRALNVVPLSYNHQLHNVQDTVRANCGMSTDLFQNSAYDRLALSLSSPLPNEHDFAFNMCTLLSNEGKHTLQLAQCPRLLEFMLAHTGVFRDKETQKYIVSNYKKSRGKSLLQFWMDSVEDATVLELLTPEDFEASFDTGKNISYDGKGLKKIQAFPHESSGNDSVTSPNFGVSERTERSSGINGHSSAFGGSADSRSLDERGTEKIIELEDGFSNVTIEEVLGCDNIDLKLNPEDGEIFHLGRDLGLLDSEGTRISQVLHILRNLSFEESNIPTLAQSDTCLRFLVLCICSRWGGLSVGALDTLGNIAAEVLLKDPIIDSSSALLLTTICQGVASQDRAVVLRSLEVLNRLSINDPNEDVLNGNVEQAVYDQVCRFLTIHDIMLLIYTLEALYSLSSMGTSSCNCIVRAKGSVQSLVSLLTVEAQSYGPDACIGMKVVETVTGVVSESDSVPAVSSSANLSTTNTPSSTTTTTLAAASTTPTVFTVQNPPQHQVITTPTVKVVTPITTPKIIPKPPATDVNKRVVPLEVEEFVTSWVLRNYDACPTNAIEQAIVYRHFAASMHAMGRKQGLNPVLLSNCVRKVFGTNVGPCRRQVEDGTEKWHYNGIKRKDGVVLPLIAEKKNTTFNNYALTPTPVIQSVSLPHRTPATPANSAHTSHALSGSILKAQLSAPLKNPPSPVKVVQNQGAVGGIHPTTSLSVGVQPPQHSTPIVVPRTDNSSLIKSLLANKVITTSPSMGSQSLPPISVMGGDLPHQLMLQATKPPPPYSSTPMAQRFQSQQIPQQNKSVVSSIPNQQPPTSGQVYAPGSVGQSGHVFTHPEGPLRSPHTPTLPGYAQISRSIKMDTNSSESQTNNSIGKTLLPSFNGICNELMKGESNASDAAEPKRVTSFEGILQNGVKENDDESFPFKDTPVGKNLLADLLEKTVGGDVLNGVVDKDLRITDKVSLPSLSQTTTHYARVNGPINANGQLEAFQGSLKRPATPDAQGAAAKRLAIEDPRAGLDGRIMFYVSQNGNEGESVPHSQSVILNQSPQAQVVTHQGQQMIIHRMPSQSNVVQNSTQFISQANPSQILSQRVHHPTQVVAYSAQNQVGQVISSTTSVSNAVSSSTPTGHTQVISTQGSPIFSTSSGQLIQGGQVLQQVIAHGQGGQKVLLHGTQLSQMLAGQMILPQAAGQNIIVQGPGNLQGQVIMQGVSASSSNQSPVIVQGANGHNQVLVQGGTSQAQMLVQGSSGQGQIVVGGVNQGQSVVNSVGQTMILAGGNGQVVVGGGQAGQHVVVSGSQNHGQVLLQGGGVGNAVFLTPQHQGSQGAQKTLIILPSPKMVVTSGSQSQNSSVVPRQVVQVVSTANSPSPVRTIRTTTVQPEYNSSTSSTAAVSVQVTTGSATGVAPPPSGPKATPVVQSHSSISSGPHIPAPQVLASGVVRRPKSSTGLQYLCEWRGCNQVFSSPGQVYHHACKIHCPPHIIEMTCQWIGCDTMVRKRFSTMTHIHDRHCNEQLLQVLALRRQQIARAGKTDIPVPQTPPPHPGYAPNAAYHAIKRHSLEVINQRDAVEKEGPVTKSIRLTAALILRNLVIYSTSGKALLKGYESQLANVAISQMESSRTVGQILYDIHLGDSTPL